MRDILTNIYQKLSRQQQDNENVIEEIKDFYKLGSLRLRLLYTSEGNKKVLVVRHSGMKISDIPSLPKGISFTGFLELQGEELNKFWERWQFVSTKINELKEMK